MSCGATGHDPSTHLAVLGSCSLAAEGQQGTGGSLSLPDPSLLLCRLSFYSGHSSFGMYCMMFLAVSLPGKVASPRGSCPPGQIGAPSTLSSGQ